MVRLACRVNALGNGSIRTVLYTVANGCNKASYWFGHGIRSNIYLAVLGVLGSGALQGLPYFCILPNANYLLAAITKYFVCCM